jgi:hypothetical protein
MISLLLRLCGQDCFKIYLWGVYFKCLFCRLVAAQACVAWTYTGLMCTAWVYITSLSSTWTCITFFYFSRKFLIFRFLSATKHGSAQVEVERLSWSFYLVWRPSWQEITGSYRVLSPPPPNNRLLLAITVIKLSFYWLPQHSDQFSILFSLPVGPGKTLLC